MKKIHKNVDDIVTILSTSDQVSFCGVRLFMDVMGGKWKFLIYSRLLVGSMRYRDLVASIPQASEKMIITSLRDLEEHKIVERIIYDEHPPRVEYKITDYGKSLETILRMIEKWGLNHIEKYPDVVYF